jgi:glutathione-regulated potassium-efflux system ancillary protein KefG
MYRVAMGRTVDVDELIDTRDVAGILGLAHRNTVSEYQAKYATMPRPVVDLGRGRSRLWLRSEVEQWHADQVGQGRTRAKRRSSS